MSAGLGLLWAKLLSALSIVAIVLFTGLLYFLWKGWNVFFFQKSIFFSGLLCFWSEIIKCICCHSCPLLILLALDLEIWRRKGDLLSFFLVFSSSCALRMSFTDPLMSCMMFSFSWKKTKFNMNYHHIYIMCIHLSNMKKSLLTAKSDSKCLSLASR